MPGTPGIRRSHVVAGIALALALGTLAAEALQPQTVTCLLTTWVVAVLWLAMGRRHRLLLLSSRYLSTSTVFAFVALLAMARWTIIDHNNRSKPLRELAKQENIIRINGVISSVPDEFERPARESGFSSNEWQTRFAVNCSSVEIHHSQYPVAGTVQVYVDGRAATILTRGDTVRITGTLTWPKPPGNPGEFDFAQLLDRRGDCGMLFVNRPEAIEIDRPATVVNPGYWVTSLRRAALNTLNDAVAPEYRSIATALLLGSRNALRAETEEQFVNSGTMHLLAISGLHIGILWLLLVRIGHWLFIPWNPRLILIAGLCIVYAFVTDLRPSVVRATIFLVLFTLSQLSMRHVSLMTIVSQTACLMLLWNPRLVFDTGAQLSFLSVLGLSWAMRRSPADQQNTTMIASPVNDPVPLTSWEHIRDTGLRIRQWLAIQYRPMLWILAATVPLTASVFHVVSPVGLVINVVLITYTAVTLWIGFGTLAMGTLLPVLPNALGMLFSWMLGGLTSIVHAAASLGAGHLYLPDLPVWFLPLWYAVLIAAAVMRSQRLRQACWLCLCILTIATLWGPSRAAEDQHLQCTVLDVGHGSAAIVELPTGHVILVDAGALGRGDRAADLVSGCLWNRGHHMIDCIVISHADVDHFGALPRLFGRFPVGQLLVSQPFARKEQELITLAAQFKIPVRLVGDGETLLEPDVDIRILQASAAVLQEAKSDNEKSLVVQIEYHGQTILLPGDLEGSALAELQPRLGQAEILISPHHGSLRANTTSLAKSIQPDHVIVSHGLVRPQLVDVYKDANVHFTSESGAVRVDISPTGHLNVDCFRENPW